VLRRRPRTKPNYQAALGAYASTPRLAKTDGAYRARGSIQAWRGSIEDLGRVGEEAHEALAEQGEQPTITGIVTLWSGKQRQLSSVDEFCAEATAVSEEQISSLRIGLAQGPMLGTIVARRTMPGVVVDVRGPNRIAVDGLARLMFTSAMGGYVDRYNGIWRPTGALATTLVPVGLFVGVGTRISDKWPAWAVVLYGVAALVATFTIMVNSLAMDSGSNAARAGSGRCRTTRARGAPRSGYGGAPPSARLARRCADRRYRPRRRHEQAV
jgi:hypothetical protein